MLEHPRMEIILLFISSPLGLLYIFLLCYFGKGATESFEKMPDCLYESNWHKIPIDQQKNVLLMLINAQRPLYYDGLNIAALNLETFCNVIIQFH